MTAATYEKWLTIDPRNVDFTGDMMISGILREAQFAANEHCDALGYGEAYMNSIRRAFFLTKLTVEIARAPRMGERVRLQTTAYAPERILYPRVARFYDEAGGLLLTVYSLWVYVDTDTLRICRNNDGVADFPFDGPCEIRRIEIPRGFQPNIAEDVPVRYSHIDKNGHVNNAEYAAIACNAIEDQLFGGAVIRTFSIVYHKEARPGAVIHVTAHSDETGAVIEGTVDGVQCFSAKAGF